MLGRKPDTLIGVTEKRLLFLHPGVQNLQRRTAVVSLGVSTTIVGEQTCGLVDRMLDRFASRKLAAWQNPRAMR
jgi:hypothetical protein